MGERTRGAVLSYIQIFVKIVTNFIYVPLLLKYLGKDEYGLYQIVGSLIAYILIFETSVSSGVLKFYCEAKSKNDKILMENTLGVARIIYWCLSALVIIAGIGVVCGFHFFYKSSFSNAQLFEGKLMIIVLLANLLVTLLNSIYLAALNAYEKFTFIKLINIVTQLIQPVLIIVALELKAIALMIVGVQLMINIVTALLRFFYARKKLGIRVALHEFDYNFAKKILFFSLTLLISSMADQIFWKTDQIILGKLYNTAVVAIYSVGAQIYTNYMYLGIQIPNVFFPKLSLLYQEEDGVKKMSDLFIKVGRLTFFVLAPVMICYAVLGKEFLFLWVGEGYDMAYYVGLIIIIPFTVDLIQHLALSIMQVTNQYRFRANMYFVAALLNIVLTIILAKTFGGIGAAVSTAISMVLTSGIILNVYLYQKVKMDICSFWKNIIKIGLPLVPYALIFGLVNYLLDIHYCLFGFLVKASLFMLLYIVICIKYLMNEYEKKMVFSVLNKIKSKVFKSSC